MPLTQRRCLAVAQDLTQVHAQSVHNLCTTFASGRVHDQAKSKFGGYTTINNNISLLTSNLKKTHLGVCIRVEARRC